MDEKSARAFLPLYAATDYSDVRVYEPKRERKKEPQEERESIRMKAEKKLKTFWKQYKIAIIVGVLFALWTYAACGITEYVTRKKTTEAVTSELRANFTEYLAQQERERQAANLLTGDASLQTAMDAEADSLARLLYGYRNNSLRDRRTLIWCVLARVDSSAYPGSVEGVIEQPQQWMFYDSGNPIREEDRQLALEQLREWHGGKYPDGFSDDFVYAEWSASDVALRDSWEKNSQTKYWRFPE